MNHAWIGRQLIKHWDDYETAHQVNVFLHTHVDLEKTILIRLGAMLSHFNAWEDETLQVLADSERVQHQWLAKLAVETAIASKDIKKPPRPLFSGDLFSNKQ